MSETRSTRSPAASMLLGSVLTLAVLGIGWAVWHATVPGERATSPAERDAAADADQPVGDAAPSAGAESVPAPPLDELAPVDSATAAVGPKVAGGVTAPDASGAAPPDSAEAATEKAADDAAQAETERELAHMEDRFEERKRQLMEIIDNYMALPVEERPGYLQEAFENLRRVAEEDRAAEGLPARPRNPGAVMRGFFQMLGTSATEEEKTKVRTFIGDVMQMQMARVQVQIEEQMGAEKPKDDLKPYHP